MERYDTTKIPEHAAITRILGRCYETFDFTDIYPYFAEDILCTSFWRFYDYVGKEDVIRYYEEKSEALRANPSRVAWRLMQFCKQGEDEPGGRKPVWVWEEPGKPCLLTKQDLGGFWNYGIIIPSFDGDGKLRQIDLHDPRLFHVRPYRDESGKEEDWHLSEWQSGFLLDEETEVFGLEPDENPDL